MFFSVGYIKGPTKMQHYTLPKYKFKFYPKINRTRYPKIALDI